MLELNHQFSLGMQSQRSYSSFVDEPTSMHIQTEQLDSVLIQQEHVQLGGECSRGIYKEVGGGETGVDLNTCMKLLTSK